LLAHTVKGKGVSYMEDNPLPSPLMGADGEIPNADDIAQELQEFLAKRGDQPSGEDIESA
ncbi:MAG: PAC2 family protein, partial [Pontimonas sp.]